MKIGLFFGSFNPIHVGHMILANYMLEYTDLDSIQFVVSPHNPMKDKESLIEESERLKLINMALVDNEKMKASDIEFKMPKPSYTIDTLNLLQQRSQENEYVIIMGTDNLENLEKWKGYEQILSNYQIYVYCRSLSDGGKLKAHPKVKMCDAHLVELSSTFIRQAIKENKDIRYLVPSLAIWNYIKRKGFYK